MACRYEIKDKNGKILKKFSSELELNEYLLNKKINNSFVLSSTEKNEVASTKIRTVMSEASKTHNNTTVSEFLTMDQMIDGAIKKLNPEYIKENRIINTTAKWIAENKIQLTDEDRINNVTLEQKAKTIIESRIEEEELMGEIGSQIHNLLSTLIINKRGGAYYAALGNIDYTKFNEAFNSKVNSSVKYDPKKILDGIVTDIYNNLQNYVNNGWTLLSEVPIATANPKIDLKEGLKGKIDIVLLDKEGVPHIYDLKVSSTEFSQWDSAKKLHTDYQLGTYRQMMAANGFQVNSSTLNIIPVTMTYGDITSLRMPKEMIINRTAAYATSTTSGLAYPNGEISRKLIDLIPAPISRTLIQSTDLSEKMNSDLQTLFPKYVSNFKTVNKNEEWLFDNAVKNTNEKGEYRLGNKFYKTQEDLRAAIQQSIKEDEDDNLSIINKIQTQMKNYLQTKSYPDDLIGIKDDAIRNNILSYNFERYTRGEWNLIDDFDELTNLGIIGFENVHSGIVEFISITVNPLSVVNNLSIGSNILGNFKNNTDAGKYQVDLMSASNENIETMKILTALNNMPEVFKNKTIGGIKVLNFKEGSCKLVNLEQSLANFSILTSLGGLDNNFNSKELKITDTADFIKSELNTLLMTSDNPNLFDSVTGEERVDLIQNKLEMFKEMDKILRSKYSGELTAGITTQTNSTTIPQKLNELIASGIAYYSGLNLVGDSNVSNWGVTLSDFKYFLTSFVSYNQQDTTESGHRVTGLLGGAHLSSTSSIQSNDLQSIYRFFDNSIAQLRRETNGEMKIITDATKKFYDASGKSQVSRAIIGYTYDLQNNLYRVDSQGKLDSRLILKNPYDANSRLSPIEREYVKTILWELNKFKSHLSSAEMQLSEVEGSKLDKIKELIADSEGSYFLVPLKRGTEVRRVSGLTINNVIQETKQRFEDMKDLYDPREIIDSQKEAISKQNSNYTKMYNQYNMSLESREKALKNNPIHYYETNLDILALDSVFAYTRERVMNDLLPIVHSSATLIKTMGRETGQDVTDILKNIEDQLKISIFNEPIISKELQTVSKIVGIPRKLTSILVIGMRPLLLVKELMVGGIQNTTRAWFKVYGEDSFDAKSLKKAYEIISGGGLHKYGNAFAGNSDFADFSFAESLNNFYGIANKDINSVVRTTQVDRAGLIGGLSQWMYIWNTAPDFMNRMTLFIAQMVQDKCFDAHTLDKEGNLVYDFMKDERFLEYTKNRSNEKYTSKTFLDQKALYEAMMDEFIKSGYRKEDGSLLKITDDLPQAYTVKQKASIKLFSDTAYGFYDHEAKSKVDHMFQGLIYKQFQTYWTGKKRLWLEKPSKETAAGHYVNALDENGNIKYRKINYDNNGNIESIEETIDNENGTLQPVKIWQGKMQEGLMYSMIFTFRDIVKGNALDSFHDKQRMGNLMLAMNDLFIGTLLTYLLTLMFTGGSGNVKDIKPGAAIPYSVMMKAVNEFNPFTSIGGMSWTPSWYKTTSNIIKNGPKVIGGSTSVGDFITNNFRSMKDWDGSVSKQYNYYVPQSTNKNTGITTGGNGETTMMGTPMNY